jgi:hypothetical protein
MSTATPEDTSEKQSEIARLLVEGLDHYGEDAIGKAIQTWRAVLALDSHNAEALDYIQTADRRDQRRLPLGEQMSDAARNVVHAVTGLVEQGDLEGALDLLRSPIDNEGTALEYEATVELVRSNLLRSYSQRVGDLAGVPVQKADGEITAYNLPPDAGFVISLIDGTTSVADIISLSGMDSFEALRIVGHLLDAGIVEIGS